MPSVTNKQLIDAAWTGDLSVLKEWKKQTTMQNEGVDINCNTNHGDNPLQYACFSGHLECVKYLIESCEANINWKDENGNTPLHDACLRGHLECIEYLTKSGGANINCQNNNGNTPLHWACRHGHLECVESLIRGLSPSVHPQLQQSQQQLKRKRQENEHKHSSHKRTNIASEKTASDLSEPRTGQALSSCVDRTTNNDQSRQTPESS